MGQGCEGRAAKCSLFRVSKGSLCLTANIPTPPPTATILPHILPLPPSICHVDPLGLHSFCVFLFSPFFPPPPTVQLSVDVQGCTENKKNVDFLPRVCVCVCLRADEVL